MPGIMSEDGDFLLMNCRPTIHSKARTKSLIGCNSLLTAMNNFVNAVDEMDGVVMIPCKLQDMHLDEDISDTTSVTSEGELSSSGSPPTRPRASSNGYTNTLVKIPEGKAVDEPAQKGLDLYTYYGMLRAVKDELVSGPCEDNDEELATSDSSDCESEVDITKQTATMFKHHLRGLFGVLQQMTGTADRLTDRYQTEIGDSSLSSNRSLSQHYTI